jgi:Galactose oxidase, central domain
VKRLLLWWVVLPWCAWGQGQVFKVPALMHARQHHTATALHDGRVLVVGGRGDDGLSTLASCEVYEPRKNRWSRCAPLHTARSHHAAVLLGDGRVLVTGGTTHQSSEGHNRFVALASSELYEPARDRWSSAAPLTDARNGHTATVLQDGTVLVVGGARAQRQHLASVERFDPAVNAWTPMPPLHVARWFHAAVMDSEGDVVVVGGRSNVGQGGRGPGVAIADVERFQVRRGVWVVLPPLGEPRQRTAVIAEPTDAGVVVIGGQTAVASTNYAETWHPGDAGWEPFLNHLSMSLASHTGTRLPSGDLVVIGGEPPNAVDTARVQRWRSASKQWCLAGALAIGRKMHSATLLQDGRVLVVGGTSSGLPEASAEVWAPSAGRCEEPAGVAMGW